MSKPPGLTTQAFEAASPRAFGRVGRNPWATATLGRIEERAARIKARAIAHHKNFEDRWVAKESIRIWERQLKSLSQSARPGNETPKADVEAIARLASRNVRARTNRRLAKINAIKTRLANSVVRSLPQPDAKRAFNHAALKDSATRRLSR